MVKLCTARYRPTYIRCRTGCTRHRQFFLAKRQCNQKSTRHCGHGIGLSAAGFATRFLRPSPAGVPAGQTGGLCAWQFLHQCTGGISGIARSGIRATIVASRTSTIQNAWLQADSVDCFSNNSRARRLYELMGYEIQASEPPIDAPGFHELGDLKLMIRQAT